MKKILFVACILLVIASGKNVEASVIYVDFSKAAGLNNGTGWADAFISFQSALDIAVSGDTIWVARGTYRPGYDYGLGGGSRYYHFRMKNGVAIYGGFAGNETAISQRTDFRAGGVNETILSGDLNGDDVVTGAGATLSFSHNDENCYHVFYHPGSEGLNYTAILDGFSITGGNANGTDPFNCGGGFYNQSASITLNNVFIYNNFCSLLGGAIGNIGSSPLITNFSMRYNSSPYAAMYSINSAPVMTNGLISDNKGETGGALTGNNSPHELTNVTITNNYASYRGGAMYSYYSDANLKNCIVWGNTAADLGHQIFTYSGGVISFIYSCYADGPNDIVHSGGSSTGSNSINADPLFANTAYRDYRLSGASPCADAGNNSYIDEPYDIRGVGYDRKLDKSTGGTGTVDMGDYEYKAGVDPLIPCNNPLNGGVIDGYQSICQGSIPAQISSVTPPAGYSGTPEFQWQLSTTDSASGFADIPGANDSVYQPAALNDTTWYRRLARVGCMNDWAGAATSNVIQITVNPLPLDLMTKDGLQAYYPFNGNAKDESGQGHDGIVYGPVLATDKESNPDYAYSFDGVNDYILIADPIPASLQIQNEITLSAWIYATQYPGSSNLGLIVGSQCDACSAAGASIFLDGRTNSDGLPCPPGHIHFQIGNGSWHASNTNSQVPLNQWVHIVATRKANENARIYYDGVLQPSSSIGWDGSVSYTGAYLAIGRQRDISNRFFKGLIDEVGVFDRSLSETEVQALYRSPSVHVVTDSMCENESTSILLFSSQKGISYQLKNNGRDSGSPQTGNEATLVFSTGILSSTSQFTIEATDTASGCSIVLDTLLNITVNPLPTVTEASVLPASLCVSGQVVFSAAAGSGTIAWYDAGTNGNKLSVLDPFIDTTTSYYAEATSPEGCVSLNRTPVTAYVYPAYSFSEEHEICSGESYSWHGNLYAVAGTYITAYTSSKGCDSTYRLKLSVKPSWHFAESHEICDGESYPWRGKTYSINGTYTDDFVTYRGCDSIYTLNLTVHTIDTSVLQDGRTLTASATDAAFQWLNCAAGYTLITGETKPDFHVLADGIYAVEITQNNCVDTSACYSITTSGLADQVPGVVSIFPNPVSDDLIIEMSGNDKQLEIEIMNVFGQVVYIGTFRNKTIIGTSHFTPGLYLVKIINGKVPVIKPIIKE